jgi:hypothetical protein
MRRSAGRFDDHDVSTEFGQQPPAHGGELVADLDDAESG